MELCVWVREGSVEGGMSDDADLDFYFTASTCLVTQGPVTPSLDEVPRPSRARELEVRGTGVLLCDGQIGARFRRFS